MFICIQIYHKFIYTDAVGYTISYILAHFLPENFQMMFILASVHRQTLLLQRHPFL